MGKSSVNPCSRSYFFTSLCFFPLLLGQKSLASCQRGDHGQLDYSPVILTISTEQFMLVYVFTLSACLHMCDCLTACLFVCALCGDWGGSEGTDGSWSVLVWCSLSAKDQAKTGTALCFFQPCTDRGKSRTFYSSCFIVSFMSSHNVTVKTTEMTFTADFVVPQCQTMNAWFSSVAL